ncbi:MAG: DedA family protein [Desulfotomaculum sp.]|nr:DedA family protein [Desulfotomaculum sp.]
MDHLTEAAFQYLSRLGFLGIFAAVLIDATGLPFPGGLMIIMSGFLVQRGDLNVFEVVTAVVLGYLCGATAAYIVGRYVGIPFILKYGRLLRITPLHFQRGQNALRKSAAAYLIMGRFIPTVGNITPYIAGVGRLRASLFLLYSTVFALIWGAFNLSIGYIFGHSWRRAAEIIDSNTWILAVGFILSYFIYKYVRHKKLNKKYAGGD